jgi:hypothetical protein
MASESHPWTRIIRDLDQEGGADDDEDWRRGVGIEPTALPFHHRSLDSRAIPLDSSRTAPLARRIDDTAKATLVHAAARHDATAGVGAGAEPQRRHRRPRATTGHRETPSYIEVHETNTPSSGTS